MLWILTTWEPSYSSEQFCHGGGVNFTPRSCQSVVSRKRRECLHAFMRFMRCHPGAFPSFSDSVLQLRAQALTSSSLNVSSCFIALKFAYAWQCPRSAHQLCAVNHKTSSTMILWHDLLWRALSETFVDQPLTLFIAPTYQGRMWFLKSRTSFFRIYLWFSVP